MPSTPIDDAMFSQQWHLQNTAEGEYDLNVVDAWDDYTGKGVKLIVIDSGLDHAHADLLPNYDTAADHDYGENDDDAAPVGSDSAEHHGTAVAGIAAAAANGTGVVGVAYEATLIGYRIDYGAASADYANQIGQAIRDAADNGGDAVNMSLGVGGYYESDAAVLGVVDSIRYAVEHGRDGLGTILVMAGGNTRQSDGNGQINGRTFDSRTEMICVAAVDRDGTVSGYSSYGANNLVSAFGSPGEIVTTDRVGSDGYTGTDFVSDFNGTSAAAPQVTGITALMLEANPNLGWRDVQSILAYSARHVGSPVDGETGDGVERYPWRFNAADNWNGGGLHYSQDYGYGLVDAHAAVRLAETWDKQSTSANQKTITGDLLNKETLLSDGNANGRSFDIKIRQDMDIERIGIVAKFQGDANQIDIYVRGPDGVDRQIVTQSGPPGTMFDDRFEFQSQEFHGAGSSGKWTVRIADTLTGTDTSFADLKIKFYGSEATKHDTYFYTDEFSEFRQGHSHKLFDTNGGTDLLNASTVTSNMRVDLAEGSGRIDSVTIQIRDIENVYAGDGNDTITGNKANNELAGGRGADTLTGDRGNDDFRYWHVRDSTLEDFDKITDFGKGKDHIDLRRIDADKNTDRNDKFEFIANADFSGMAGQLHYARSGGKTFVEGDVDGDGLADFAIALSGNHHLDRGDFML